MGRLDGLVGLVTGGTRGIGRAIVEAFLREGAKVVYGGVSRDRVDATQNQFGDRCRCRGIVADLSVSGSEKRLVEKTVAEFQRLDILVNNAGMSARPDLWSVTSAEWDRVLNINLRAAFFCALAAANAMRDHGGSIINIASVAGQIGGLATGPAYVAAKAGLIGLTKSLARHLAKFDIRVNAISPADIDTDMTAEWPSELRERLINQTPLARFGTPQEVADVTVFLASKQASFITGQTLNVNGGLFMG